ncbi:MAG: ATP-dependent zinc metalloprotease FtsH [Acidobacteriota bacterium]
MQFSKKDRTSPTEGKGPGSPKRSKLHYGGLLFWLILLIIAVPWMLQSLSGSLSGREKIPYSTFRSEVKQGQVATVTVKGQRLEGKLKTPAKVKLKDKSVTYTTFLTYLPSFGDDSLMGLLQKKGVDVETEPTSTFSWMEILLYTAPFLLLLWLGWMFLKRMGNQGNQVFSMGKSRAKLYERHEESTLFDDVAGAEGVKAELREIIEFLKNPERFTRLGGKPPKGVLLVGPPGTGKTLLARATAGESGAPFFSITGSDFMEMFVGVGAARVRALFQDARKSAPAIIFIDELDSIGRRRGAGLGGGHDEREQTLNQLLSEMDGFEPQTEVIIIGATNRPDILDPALLRPGRFDRRIIVQLPGVESREAILKVHARGKPLDKSIDLSEVARSTPGFSGADLENLLNEAALIAAGKHKDVLEIEDTEEARDKILLGLQREGLALTRDECRLLAYHEGGHAVVAALLPHADPLHKVSIIPRGKAMGVTQQLPARDRYVYSREYMLDRMAIMMGGRAAEELVLGTATSGAENDLKEAARLARKMVLDWSMAESLGHVALGSGRQQVFLGEELTQRREYSETTAREVDMEVRGIVEEAYARAVGTLKQHRQGLDAVADALLEKEEIPGREVLEHLGISQRPPGQVSGAQG